ncbi:hypothetical protein ACLKA6_017315 [Drosophila palustris]
MITNMKIKKKEQNQPQHIQNSIDQSYTVNLLTIKHPATSIQNKNASLNWQANINKKKLLKITNCHVSGYSGSRHLEQQKLANTQLHNLNNERGLQSCQSSGKLASEQYPFTLMSSKLQNTANPHVSPATSSKIHFATECCTHRGSEERKRQEQQQQQQQLHQHWIHPMHPNCHSSGSNSAATEQQQQQQHNFNGDFSNCQTLAAASNSAGTNCMASFLAAFPSSLDHKMLDLAAFVQSWRILGELCKKT